MTERVISDWIDENTGSKAVVKYNDREEMFLIDYYDAKGHKFFSEDFPNKSLQYVEDAAVNWTLGIKKIA